MKIVEFRKKTREDMAALLEEKRRRKEELVGLLREKKTKNVKELREVKKDIARISTLLAEGQKPND